MARVLHPAQTSYKLSENTAYSFALFFLLWMRYSLSPEVALATPIGNASPSVKEEENEIRLGIVNVKGRKEKAVNETHTGIVTESGIKNIIVNEMNMIGLEERKKIETGRRNTNETEKGNIRFL